MAALTRTHIPGDTWPTVYAALGPDSGFHAADVNLTLQNLVDLLAAESKSWLHH